MILRRIGEGIKNQDWFVVVIEIFIVVIGIYLGLQVDDWNKARQDRVLEQEYLERLKADMVASVEAGERKIAALKDQVDWEGFMLERLKTCSLSEEEAPKFASGIFEFGRLEPGALFRGTIDELQSTGRINLIRSIELRTALDATVRGSNEEKEVLGYIIIRATPQIAYLDSRVIIDIPPPGELNSTTPYFPPQYMDFDFEAMCSDRAFKSAVSTMRVLTQVSLFYNQGAIGDFQNVITLIDAELGITHERETQ